MNEKTRLVIVGAGIAGLSAAKTLQDNNFQDFILLEAQDYVGGRINSIPWNEGFIEEGAQFLHGDKSKLAKLCEQNDLLLEEVSYEGKGIFIQSDGQRIDKKLVDQVDDLICDALEDCEKYAESDKTFSNVPRNITEVIDSKIYVKNKLINNILDWNRRFLIIDNSCSSLDDLSAKYWGKFRFVGGADHRAFKAGYTSVVKLLKKNLNDRNLRLNSPVKRIELLDNLVTVHLETGGTVLADCVIVTCSLGYLKENYETLFQPQLPKLTCSAIRSLGFGTINKIFLDFSKAWWETGVEGFQLIFNQENNCDNKKLAEWTKDLTGFDVLQCHEAVLVGWVGGRGAELIESLTDQEVSTDCIQLLRYFLKNKNLPAPKRCRRTRWQSNKYFRGSYCNISTKCDADGITPAVLAEPIYGSINGKKVPVLMLAGEATHDTFYSTTHGAFDTGVHQAQTFLKNHVENFCIN